MPRVFGVAVGATALLRLAALTPPALALEPFGTEFQANTYTTYDQATAAVASLANGQFVVVWESGSLSTTQDGHETGIFAQRFALNGKPLGSEFRVNSYTTDTQEHPSVAAHSDASFLVVWDGDREDGSEEGIFARLYTSAGQVGSEFRVNSYTTDFQTYPGVAAAGDEFVVVWESFGQDGSHGGIFAQRLSGSGVPVGTEFRVNGYTTNFQRFASVAGNAAGAFVVVWESEPELGGIGQDGSDAGIFGQRYAAGGSAVGSEFQVNTYTTDRQTFPDVAMADDGSFIVAWEGRMPLSDDGPDEVSLRHYDADGEPADNELLVNTYVAKFEEEVAIAKTAGGDFLVVWKTEAGGFIGDDNFGESIIARRVSAEGDLIGPELQINSHIEYDQDDPAVAGVGTGFVVVWRSSDQDGSGSGVFGQVLIGETPCGDATADGNTTASDALQALKAAVGSGECLPCVCDVNNSGGINATDALIILRVVVGQSVGLTCPAC